MLNHIRQNRQNMLSTFKNADELIKGGEGSGKYQHKKKAVTEHWGKEFEKEGTLHTPKYSKKEQDEICQVVEKLLDEAGESNLASRSFKQWFIGNNRGTYTNLKEMLEHTFSRIGYPKAAAQKFTKATLAKL